MDLENPKYWKLLVNQSMMRYFLLKSLEDKATHGYALSSVINMISGGLSKPSQGTIYPALNELEKNGYVKGKWIRIRNRERKVYILTTKGRTALAVASQVLQRALTSVFKESSFGSG